MKYTTIVTILRLVILGAVIAFLLGACGTPNVSPGDGSVITLPSPHTLGASVRAEDGTVIVTFDGAAEAITADVQRNETHDSADAGPLIPDGCTAGSLYPGPDGLILCPN